MTRGSSTSVESLAKEAPGKASILDFKNLYVSIPSKQLDGDQASSQQDKKAASRWRRCRMTSGQGMKPILRGVSGSLRGGELTAILGPSGAGKTTLFDALMGRAHNRGGQVSLDGLAFDKSFRDITGLANVPYAQLLASNFDVVSLAQGEPRSAMNPASN